jgi:hypothetical protein
MFTTDLFLLHSLPEVFFTSFGIFMMFYMFVNSYSGTVSSSLFKTYDTLPVDVQADWRSRISSNIHAIITAVVGIIVFFNNRRYMDMDLFHNDQVTTILMGCSTAYLITDTILILKYYPKLGGVSMLLHHVFVCASQFSMLVYNKMYLLGVVTCFTEVTTPFINQRWYFEKCDMKNGLPYVINGLLIWLMWLIFRVGHVFYLVALFYYKWEVFFIQAPLFLGGFITLSAVILASLNLMWFQKITAGIIKVLTASKSKTKVH